MIKKVFSMKMLILGFIFFGLSWVQCESVKENQYTDVKVDQKINTLIKQYNLPSMACAVINNGEIIVKAAQGVRWVKANSPSPQVTVADKYHIGSDTKAMTALLAGMAVEKNEIAWSSTVGDLLSGEDLEVPEVYRTISLEQLLSHTTGISNFIDGNAWNNFRLSAEPGSVQRQKMLPWIFKKPLAFKPGESYMYSNFGYVLAGAMLEKACAMTWEELLQTRIWNPLAMNGSGFGPPARGHRESQPWGHNPVAVNPDSPGADNPSGIGPAGTVHSNIDDLSVYSLMLLNEGNPLISAETFQRLITPVRKSYALGWVSFQTSRGLTISHDGSNTMFYARLHLYPELKSGVIILVNSGTTNATSAVNDLQLWIEDEYL